MTDKIEPDEEITNIMVDHLIIRDKDTGEVFVNQRDTLSRQHILGNSDARED